eukprot:scaffold2807_cov60-Phaeocystis_antarctica.AAC.7
MAFSGGRGHVQANKGDPGAKWATVARWVGGVGVCFTSVRVGVPETLDGRPSGSTTSRWRKKTVRITEQLQKHATDARSGSGPGTRKPSFNAICVATTLSSSECPPLAVSFSAAGPASRRRGNAAGTSAQGRSDLRPTVCPVALRLTRGSPLLGELEAEAVTEVPPVRLVRAARLQ